MTSGEIPGLKERGIRSARVLEALARVPREVFVPKELRSEAYRDAALPIGHGQTISQPFIVAFMTQALDLSPSDRVLEIGTGSGYQTAVLAELAKEIYTIEILESLAGLARARLAALGYRNVRFQTSDGHAGWAAAAPFDAILLTAAPETIPDALLRQLGEGGRLVAPIGLAGTQKLIRTRRARTGYAEEALLPVAFVPMVGCPGGPVSDL